MERRSFVATLFAPLLRRFLPVKPAAELPVQSVPLMGCGALRYCDLPYSQSVTVPWSVITKFDISPKAKVLVGDALVIGEDGKLTLTTELSQAVGFAMTAPDASGMASVILRRPS